MKHFSLRFDDDLHAWLKADAKAHRRSLNEHLEYLVDQERKRQERRARRQEPEPVDA